MSTKLDLDHLERLCESATPGPWYYTYEYSRPESIRRYWSVGPTRERVATEGSVHTQEVAPVAEAPPYTYGTADAQFIAAARTALPALVARVRELEGALRLIAQCSHSDACDVEYDMWCPGCEPRRFAERHLDHPQQPKHPDRKPHPSSEEHKRSDQ